jgi:hypothetical protein
LLFVGLPLLVESAVYLFQQDIFPSYLPFSVNFRNLLIGFVLIGVLLIGVCVVLALLFRIVRIPVQYLAPSAFFFLFLALTLNRLLPRESGLSLPRLLVFAGSFLLAGGFYVYCSKTKVIV